METNKELITDAQVALQHIRDRIALTHRICCGLAPKQAVGEGIAVIEKMPEWETVTAALSQRSEAVDERKLFEKQASDTRFFPRDLDFTMGKSPSGRDEYVNTHLQSRWEGWEARAAMNLQPAPAPSAAAGEQVQAPKLTQAELSDPEFMQGYVDECYRVYVEGLNYWKNLATQPTPAQGDAVPVGLSDEDIVGVLHGCGIDTHPSKYGFKELQVSATSIPSIREVVRRCSELLATRQSSADAVDAARYRWLRDTQYIPFDFDITKRGIDYDLQIDAAIAAQGGKGGA